MRNGYDENFLNGVLIPLPVASLALVEDLLQPPGLNHDKKIVPYIHYSLVMSKSTRQALFSAANLDQNKIKSVRGRKWFVDPRIGLENQINNDAYRQNFWDRGHLTRRTAVTWGGNDYDAKRASNDSCSYANACLQHMNFNQDEWRVPEKIVQSFSRDIDGKYQFLLVLFLLHLIAFTVDGV